MYRPPIRHAVPLSVAVALALGLSFFFFGGRATRGEATEPSGAVVPDSVAEPREASNTTPADTVVPEPETPPAVTEPTAAPSQTDNATPAATPSRTRAGEDPDFAAAMGWPVQVPDLLPGSILPNRRIIAYYGNPLSTRMGALGEFEKAEMLERFERQLEEWRRADPQTPVQPALHLIAVVAQGEPGPSGKYRTIMRDTLVEMVYGWAKEKNAILFIDIQTGHSDIRELLPRFEHFLTRPDVHVGIDPEFMMKTEHKPGAKVGTMDAADINYAADYLADLVRKHDLPPKLLVIHRFTRGMVTNSKNIALRPEVQIVMHMDGWGAAWLKRDTYKDYIVREPVQYTGFKLFYHNDTKKGDPLMLPGDLLRLRPIPLYIQYQ